MKPRKMQPRIMWALIDEMGKPHGVVVETRREAREDAKLYSVVCRVVRVRVTEAP